MKLDKDDLKNILIGGCILGGGGGGSRKSGEIIGAKALDLSELSLIEIDQLEDDDLVVSVSHVGAPSSKSTYVDDEDYRYTIDKIQEELGQEIKGIITIENGGAASTNGWLQSALSGIDLLDAPANGRAHPTGIMGSLNLHQVPNYQSIQVYSGGNPKTNNKIQGVVKGSLHGCASIVRQASVEAGGMVVVARNPVTVEYLKSNGAIGAIKQAIELGEMYYKDSNHIQNAVDYLGGQIVTQGVIEEYTLSMEGGFDVGTVVVGDYQLTFWNEYMTLEKNNKRISTFPDLIMTFDSKTKLPVTTAEIYTGQEITVISVPKDNLLLGSPMRDPKLLNEIRDIINKEMI